MLKRIRRGAYESLGLLVLYVRWTNERWDGPREKYRPWKVYKAGSSIESRLLLNAFPTLQDAFRFVQKQTNPSTD